MRDFECCRSPCNTGLEPCVAHRPAGLCSSSCDETLKVASSKFSNFLLVGRDSVEPAKIEATPRSVALPQWQARAFSLSCDLKCKNKSQVAKIAAATSRQLV